MSQPKDSQDREDGQEWPQIGFTCSVRCHVGWSGGVKSGWVSGLGFQACWNLDFGTWKTCPEGFGELFCCEDWLEIMQVHGIATFPLLRVDDPLSGEGVRFGSKFSGVESDYQIESRKEFQPLGLSSGQGPGGSEIFEILVVRKYLYRDCGSLKVMSPDRESFEYCKEFLIMGVIVQFCGM